MKNTNKLSVGLEPQLREHKNLPPGLIKPGFFWYKYSGENIVARKATAKPLNLKCFLLYVASR
jgi:hypothetical protein